MAAADLRQIIIDAAKIVSVAYKTKNSVVNAVGFIGPVLDLKGQNFSAAMEELKALSKDDISALEQSFFANLDLGDAAAQAKVASIQGFFEQSLTLIEQGIVLVEQAIVLEKQVQAFLGL